MGGRRVGVDPAASGVGMHGGVGSDCIDQRPVESLHETELVHREQGPIGGAIGGTLELVVVVLALTVRLDVVRVDVVDQVLRQLPGIVVLLLLARRDLLDHLLEEGAEEDLRVGVGQALLVEERVQIEACAGILDAGAGAGRRR